MATPRPHAAPGGFGFRALLAAFLGGDYVRDFFRGVAVQTALVVLLIEAIFLAERFTPVFREAVRHEADLFGISLILLCTSPEVFDLALAVAILMACYAMLMKMRENRELLVLFASGLGPYQLSALVLVVAVFLVANVVENYFLVPKLVGDRIGLHPVAVIFAVLAFGDMFGFIGVLLALPLASIAVVLLRFLRERYEASPLYAGREQTRILSASGTPVEAVDAAPPEPPETPPEP